MTTTELINLYLFLTETLRKQLNETDNGWYKRYEKTSRAAEIVYKYIESKF